MEQADLALAAESDTRQLCCAGALVRPRRRRARLVLERADPRKLGRQHSRSLGARVGTRPQWLLEARGHGDGRQQRLVQPVGTGGDAAEQRWVGSAQAAEMRHLRVRRLRLLGGYGSPRGRDVCGLRLRPQLLHLGRERAPPGFQLEQDGLGGLAREPELAALWVVPESLTRHRRDRRRQQLVQRDDRQLGDALGRALADQHSETAEACISCAPEQRQTCGSVIGHDRRRTPAERGRNGSLCTGRHVEQRKGQLGALVREHPRGGGNALALGQ